MDAVVSVTFNRYSFETMNLHAPAREALGKRGAHARAARLSLAIPDCDKFDVDLVELSFDRVQDPAEREYLDRVPTAFTLSPEQIIRLRRAAHLLVDESPELRVFLEESARSGTQARQVGRR